MHNFFNFKINKNIYLDHAAATPLCIEAREAMREADKYYANPSSIHKAGMEANQIVKNSRETISKLINARSNEIYFTGSGTESINLSLIGLAYEWHKQNNAKNKTKLAVTPKIITTRIEHSATLETLKYLESKKLIELIYLDLDEYGFIKLESIRKILDSSGTQNTENILCVSIIYANNETGVVQSAKEIGRIINLYNLKLEDNLKSVIYNLDACQAINYLNIDVYNLKCHMMTFNSNKIYGPKGVGALYISNTIKLTPIIHGGEQERGLRSGTLNVSGIAGFGAAVEMTKVIKDLEVKRLIQIQNEITKLIKEAIPESTIYTPINDMVKIILENEINYNNIKSIPNIINIGLPRMRSDDMVIRLSGRGIYASHRSACGSGEDAGSHVLMAIERSVSESNENIRLSMGRDTSLVEMERVVREIKELYYKFRAIS